MTNVGCGKLVRGIFSHFGGAARQTLPLGWGKLGGWNLYWWVSQVAWKEH